MYKSWALLRNSDQRNGLHPVPKSRGASFAPAGRRSASPIGGVANPDGDGDPQERQRQPQVDAGGPVSEFDAMRAGGRLDGSYTVHLLDRDAAAVEVRAPARVIGV